MLLEAFSGALHNFGDLSFWLFIIGGVITGILFGFVPGVGGLTAMALTLPFVFLMKPEQSLPFMVAIDAVCVTGGSITAILLNIPGDAPNAATLLDGYPMTRMGQGGRAVGAALMSSTLGGIGTVFWAFLLIPMILPIILSITSADMVFLVLWGISFIAILARGSTIKGVISGGLGLLFSFVGYDLVSGIPRFSFGSTYLYEGIPLVPIGLGIFAMPEMVVLAMSGETIVKKVSQIERLEHIWEGAKDVFRHWSVWLRSCTIGFGVGIIPGIGGITASFVAYGQAKLTSKHPERFGTGVVEGVIAPESANNAKEAGSLLTSLAIGLPGSAPMAILLAALIISGIAPGPEMLIKRLDLSIALFLVIVVANIIAAIICFPFASTFARIALVPNRILVPIVMSVLVVAAYINRGYLTDVIIMFAFTALGLAMRRFGYNGAALFLGFILGARFENYLFIALSATGPLFFLRPISLVLILSNIALFTYKPIKNACTHRFRRRGR